MVEGKRRRKKEFWRLDHLLANKGVALPKVNALREWREGITFCSVVCNKLKRRHPVMNKTGVGIK